MKQFTAGGLWLVFEIFIAAIVVTMSDDVATGAVCV